MLGSKLIYRDEDFEYLKKYLNDDFLISCNIGDLLLELNYVIVKFGFDDKMERYNNEGKRLQEIYDNIYEMN